jgi:hypothetical protein
MDLARHFMVENMNELHISCTIVMNSTCHRMPEKKTLAAFHDYIKAFHDLR